MDVLIIQPDRSSTETSIFSIYSMYMEDTPRNSLRIPSVSLTLPDDHKDDFFVTSDLAYYDSSPPRPPSSSAPSSSPRTPSDRLFDDRRTLGGRSSTSSASSGLPASSKHRLPANSPSQNSIRSSRSSLD